MSEGKKNASTRCEICHQPFPSNSQTERCERCSEVVVLRALFTEQFPLVLSNLPAVRQQPVNWRRISHQAAGTWLCLMLMATPMLYTSLARQRSNNQASVQQLLRKINTGEVTYSLGLGKGNYTTDLSSFYDERHWRVFDETDSQAQTIPKSGYLLGPVVTIPGSTCKAAEYSITAYPAVKTGLWRTGDDCFYVDDSGGIRHSGSATIPADDNSPPI